MEGKKSQRIRNRIWKRELRNAGREMSRARKRRQKEKPDFSEKKTKGEREKTQETFRDLPFSRASLEIPVKSIRDGIIYTADGRYVKILEVMPINFLHRSASEQRNIIYSFMGYLKIAPPELQIKSISKKADITQYIAAIRENIKEEENERCRMLQQDYANLICSVGYKEAVTRRFFLVFQADSRRGTEKDIINTLMSYAQTAKKYLYQCGNQIDLSENPTEEAAEIFYTLLNRKTSTSEPFSERLNEVVNWYMKENGEESTSRIPVTEFFAPKSLDFRHGNYVLMDGVYHAYLFIPSARYRSRVPAGWMSLLVNAGEGIDVDLFLYKQDKTKCIERIGRRIRLNRSKIKDTSDTNTDFDSLAESIQAGYYLKNGLTNEDFYYITILITVTGYSAKEVDWRAKEMRKLLNAQDIDTVSCIFKEEQAFFSSLPLLKLDKSIYERSKRNVLTSGAASCYPFTSFEMSDKNGILMGVNTANSSLVIVDIFNSSIYKNANIAIMGTTGSGKTFFLQLMALRMRRKNIQVYIIAPDKGHEFARACNNIGGEFIKISSASKNCINIMEIRKRDRESSMILDGELEEGSELAIKIEDLHIFFSLLIPDMDYEEKQLLDEALVQTYAEKGITYDNDSLVNTENPEKYRPMPILGDVYDILIQKPETKRMANILNRLVHGSASSFNQQTNVNLDNKYTVLDISDLTGDILTVGMFVALNYVWSKVKEDRTVEKAIFLDEVWQLIGATSNELVGGRVLEIFKIIRAYGGSAVCATQDLSDFMALKDGKYGRGIINACKTKIVLNLENDEAKKVQELLHLSDAELMEIVHFERGKGMLSTNSNNLTVEFKASQLEKDLITTDRKDLKELKERLKKFGNQAYTRGV